MTHFIENLAKPLAMSRASQCELETFELQHTFTAPLARRLERAQLALDRLLDGEQLLCDPLVFRGLLLEYHDDAAPHVYMNCTLTATLHHSPRRHLVDTDDDIRGRHVGRYLALMLSEIVAVARPPLPRSPVAEETYTEHKNYRPAQDNTNNHVHVHVTTHSVIYSQLVIC